MQMTSQQLFSQGDVHPMSELELKLRRIQELLGRYSLNALLLRQASSFAWATCGGVSTVNIADSHGLASILITPDRRYILTDNIEAPRLQEEGHLQEQDWEFRVRPWHEHDSLVAELTKGLELGADSYHTGAFDLQMEIARLRASLLPEEVERFRALCKASAEAMDAAIMSIRPRLTEHQIAGILAREALSRGIEPIVHLVGTDERIFKYRHPLPTDKRLDRYAMLVLCGRKWGLVSSITRLVHFGRMPGDLRAKAEATARVDATFMDATRPGRTLGEIFARAAAAYAETGFDGEWQLH